MQRIAIIGLGIMGRNHYNTLKNIETAEIVGLCDIENFNNLSEPFFTDLETMLIELNPDALVIATPTSLHKQATLLCTKHNVNMLIEKPAASSVEDAREMSKAIEEKGLKSCIGHIERYNPVVKALIKEIGNDEVLSISITRSGAFPERIADVGILTDLSVHDSDLIRFITKKDIVKSAVFKSQKIHKTHEDNAILAFELEGDVVGDITTNWLTPYRKRSIAVACRESTDAEIKYFEADLLSQTLKERINIDSSSHTTRNCFVSRSNALHDEVSAFIHYLETGDKGSLSSVEDSIITLEIASDS